MSKGWLAMCALVPSCGAPSAGSACAGQVAAGDVAITEVFASYKGAGGDLGHEWFEIYNATDRALDLAGVTVANGRPDGTQTQEHLITALTIAPYAYVTLGDVAPDQLPPWITYGYGDALGMLGDTGADQLSLACGSAVLAKVLYGATRPGHARELTIADAPAAVAGDDPASWCDAVAAAFAPDNDGTPLAASDCVAVPAASCADGSAARPIATPAPGALVITEVMPNPAGPDAHEEWFEITNASTASFDLAGLGLDRAGDSRDPDVLSVASCAPLAPGAFAVFARDADPAKNGGLPAVAATFTFSLIGGTADAPGDVRVLAGAEVLDAVTWTHAPTAAASQLDPSATDADSNDDPAVWCAATAPYGDGTNAGTPGAINGPCTANPLW
jgi:hypothetical protein